MLGRCGLGLTGGVAGSPPPSPAQSTWAAPCRDFDVTQWFLPCCMPGGSDCFGPSGYLLDT
jgi:hypothetical protein